MTINEIKRIPIADFLHALGFRPHKRQGANLWYLSPLRREREASFKVNASLNAWYDFGAGRGGNIIDLALEFYGTDSVADLLQRMAEHSAAIRPVYPSFPRQAPDSFQNLQLAALSSPALLSYLQERGIPEKTAKRACRELHFTTRGKPYFAIGFPNAQGGYEVRNRYFKGCISPKAITLIRQQETQETCYVFEGFMDYLSFLTLRQQRSPVCPGLEMQDCLVLNSVTTLSQAAEVLEGYGQITCMLDNDEAGRRATDELKRRFPLRVSDHSVHYGQYRDLNDCLCRRKKL
jgi:hypothetical protein